MSNTTMRTEAAVHAYTDLYDEKQRTFLIRYPTWLLTTLIMTGVAAFALAAFLGDVNHERGLLPPSAPLFLWICALIITLQWSIFRNRVLLVERWASIITTLIGMVLVAIYYFAGQPNLGQNVNSIVQGIRFLTQDLPTLAIINFGLLIIFLVDSIRRWVLCAQGKSFIPHVNIGLGISNTQEAPKQDSLPPLNELVSGDMIAGGIFIFFMALFFTPASVNFFLNGVVPHVTADCSIVPGGWGPCVRLGGAISKQAVAFTSTSLINDPRLLSFFDLLTTLVLLIPGLLILAPSALSSVIGTSPELGTNTTPAPRQTDSASTGEISTKVSEEVIDTLGAGLTRRLQFSFAIALRDLALRFRHVVWPLLIIAGVFGASAYAREQTHYLHLVRAADQCHNLVTFYTCVGNGTNLGLVTQLFALIGAAIAIAGIVFSAAALAFSWRVSTNTGMFLLLLGFILALIMWIISLVMSLINLFYYIVELNVTSSTALHITAFPQPSIITALSLLFFLRYAIPWLVRRIRNNGKPVGPMVDFGTITNGRRLGAPVISPTPVAPTLKDPQLPDSEGV